ncbi:putative uncharacterized protein [Blautia sp. CAG:237]|jgi:hypothetical protein|uniref:DUF551 domain-containing protein n=1 Tax=Blautia sp. CAG:237 TaxID=1262755 RepID=UPI00033AC358|nr:DUF551 domain-containing protein [Blautia sp. CAG:237]CDB76592.1 putative uncharacterized protein [Blautia sp. CAG:237]
MSSVKMIKLEDGDYVPEECCTFVRNFETGEMEIDDVILPCGCDCSRGGTLDISCESCVIQKIMNEYGEQEENRWIPVSERLPDPDEYILVSFENFSVPMISRYTVDDEDNGTFRIGDEVDSFVDNDLFVNAWMPLPKPYKEKMNDD